MTNTYEKHVLKLNLYIKQIQIQDHNSGQLSLQVRTDQDSFPLDDRKYLLDNHRCFVNDRIQVNMKVNYDKDASCYLQSQVTIFVFLESGLQKSVSSYVRFNPFQGNLNIKQWDEKLSSALPGTIAFTSRFQIINVRPTMLSPGEQHRFDEFLKKSKHIDKSQFKKSRRSSEKSIKNDLFPSSSKGNSPIKKSNINEAFLNNIIKTAPPVSETNKTKKIESPKPPKEQPRIVVKSPKNSLAQSRVCKAGHQYQMQRIRRKVEQEREEKARSISKLKMERNTDVLKGQYPHWQSEVGKYKDKIRNLERKQKNFVININDLSRQLQKTKQKQTQLQKIKAELERALGQKQIKLRTANTTIRNLQEQIDSLNSRERVVNRKGQVRQNIFKEQAKRLEERLREAEMEINDVINDKNQKIKQIAELEKKHHLILKERDLKLSQQKSKTQKIRQEMVQLQKTYQFSQEQLKQRNQATAKQSNGFQQRIYELEIIMLKYENDVAELKQNLKKQKQNCLEIEVKYEKTQSQELISQKKKFHEMNSEFALLKQKLRKIENQLSKKDERLKQLQEGVKDKGQINHKHIARIHNLQRQIDSIRQENNRKVSEIQHLRATISALNDKVATHKQKMEGERFRKEQAHHQLEKQISIFNKQKDLLQNQISQYKWAGLRYNDRITELESKLRTANDQSMKYSQNIMAKDQKIMTLEDNAKMNKFQLQRLEKEVNSLTLKLRQNLQTIKLKNILLQDEKKLRLQVEQRYQEQKRRNEHYQQSNRNRELQDQKRIKQKQQLNRQKYQQYQNIQTQLFKKNEELLTLKTTVEMTMREIELTKGDYDSIKNQYNLLQTQHNDLKLQKSQLSAQNQQLQTQLTIANQKTSMHLKKIESLKADHEDYKQAIRASVQNLVNEFYKDETNTNIIATTLLPFPDQHLSNLQVQFVQKRNTFIVKQKQFQNESNQLINNLETQLKEMKMMYENRQNQQKKQENEQRDKLKGLLYEGMIQKNNLNEELNITHAEKQELYRQLQRLKRQMLNAEQNQQELSGQLQLLLVEHQSMKVENQELNNTIFKFKQQTIKNKSIEEQKIMEMQQQQLREFNRLKEEIVDKDRRIILLEKQKLELEDKLKKYSSQKNVLKQQADSLTQKIKYIQTKTNSLNEQVTTLNNIIKNQQRQQTQNKALIDRLQTQIKQAQMKQQSLNSNLNKIQNQLMQQTIEKQKLISQVNHLKERLEETNRIHSEKGQISKQKIDKKMEQNGNLKSKVIEQQSELSLKQFYLKQKDQQLSILSKQKQQLKQQLAIIKSKLKETNQIKQSQQLKIRQCHRQMQRVDAELRRSQDSISKGNCTILVMEEELASLRYLEHSLKEKQKQCIKLKQQKHSLDQHAINEAQRYQESIGLLRKQLDSQKKYQNNMRQQHKKKIERTQSQNSQKYNYLLFEFQKEKEQFNHRVHQIQQHNRRIIGQLQGRIQVMRQQLSDSKQNQRLAQEEIYKRQNQITSVRKKLKELDQELQDYRQKYNKYYLLYQQTKSEKEQIMNQNQQKLAKTLNESKFSQIRIFNKKLNDISRQIGKLKYSQQLDLQKQSLNRRQFLNTLTKIFNLIDDIVVQSYMKQQTDSTLIYRPRKSGKIY